MMTKLAPGVDGRDGDGFRFWPPRDVGNRPLLVVLLVLIIGLGALMPAGLAIYYGSVQRKLQYVIDGNGLSVRYGVGRIDIPAHDIVSVEYVPEPPRMGRVVGAGMKSLQMGWYRLDDFGRIYRLTTTRQNIVFVDTSPDATAARPGTRYAFSPADVHRFVQSLEDVQAGRGLSAGPDNVLIFDPVPVQSSEWWVLSLVIVVLVLPTGIGLPWIARRGQRGMSYHVGPEGITVNHLGKKLYRWDTVVGVKEIREPLPRLWRTFGAALPGYYAGQFTAGRLGRLQVNATRIKPPVVLVETTRGNVLLSPRDIDGFLRAVEQYRGTPS